MASIINNLANATGVSLLGARQRSGAGATNGTGVDISAYEGTVLVTLNGIIESGTTPTLDVKLQESDTSGGTYVDIAGAAFTQQTAVASAFAAQLALPIDGRKQFIRAVATNGGTSPVVAACVQLVGMKKYTP